jgi:hypothetical protein
MAEFANLQIFRTPTTGNPKDKRILNEQALGSFTLSTSKVFGGIYKCRHAKAMIVGIVGWLLIAATR